MEIGLLKEITSCYKSPWQYLGVRDTWQKEDGLRGRVGFFVHGVDPFQAYVKVFSAEDPRFTREYLSAQLVSSEVAPAPMYLDIDSRTIVRRDVGPHETLAHIFKYGTREHADEALETLAMVLPKLHMGNSVEQYDRNLKRNPFARDWVEPALNILLRKEISFVKDHVRDILRIVKNLGAGTFRDGPDAIRIIAESHYNDLHLTHGNLSPEKVLVYRENPLRAAVRVVEFGMAAYRPRLYDLSGFFIDDPLPSEKFEILKQGYVEAYAPAAFDRNWASTCAFRALSMAARFGPEIVETNAPHGDGWDRRSALAVACSRAAQANLIDGHPTRIYEVLAALAAATQLAWEVTLPRWPAFDRNP